MKHMLKGALGALLIGTSASAATFDVDFEVNIAEPTFSGGFSVETTLIVDPATALLSVFELTVEGDLDSASENFSVELDGLSLGTLLNNNTADDDFGFSGGTDVGSVDGMSSVANLMLDVSGITGDGEIVLSFFTSSGVNAPSAVNDGTFPGLTGQFAAKGTLTFGAPSTVPLPSAGLLLLGAFGAAFGVRKSKAS